MVDLAMRRLLRRSAPRSAAARPVAWGGLRYGAPAVVMLAIPLMLYPRPAAAPAASQAPAASTAAPFRQIVLPDLVVIEPNGLSPAQVAQIGKTAGVRDVLAVDGARISIGGHLVNVLGVDPQVFRSWTPLRTASDSRLWAALAAGEFLASQNLRQQYGLQPGARYPLAGAAPQDLAFGGSAQFGVAGIDVVVSNQASAGLGLVHDVAAFVSAPGAAMGRLMRQVRAVAGAGATLTDVRPQQLPVDQASAGVRPASYLELFKASAALYCPGLSWTVLAAIGQIESGDGANMGPSSAGALGPMQFMPATWAQWGMTAFGEKGPPNVMDPYDAVPSAARDLCAAGAAQPSGLYNAIFAYNHADWYVREVLALAQQYAAQYG